MSLLWRRRRDLHRDQIRAIEGLDVDGRYLLLGPPGSGKTSILLHRGQYLRLAPHSLRNVRLVTFTRTLREFIAVSGDDRFPPSLIQTAREFVDEIYNAYHVPVPRFPDGTSLEERNRVRAATILDVINSRERMIYFDALLVDEIQDLSPEEIHLFNHLSDRIMMAGDKRQRLFDARGALEAAVDLQYENVELRHHFRISRDICKMADAILLPGDYRLEEFCHYQGPTPTLPQAHGDLDRTQQFRKLIESLDVQLDTYNAPDDLIGIVLWAKRDCDFMYEQLMGTRFGALSRVFHSGIADRSFAPGSRICVVTVQSCKGLEFRALHWLFVDESSYYITRERAYTVITRAKSSLTIYHHAPLPGFLAGSLPGANRGLFEEDNE